jgi:hypothetical protein
MNYPAIFISYPATVDVLPCHCWCLFVSILSKVGVLTAPYSIGEDTNRGQLKPMAVSILAKAKLHFFLFRALKGTTTDSLKQSFSKLVGFK